MSRTSREWVWPDAQVVLAVHDEQLAEHGGGAGIRDANLFESALARPKQLVNHAEHDAADLAASYGVGIARNHPFIDGNKRIAFVVVELFLVLNGFDLTATDANCVLTMLDVASGTMDETPFAAWIRQHRHAL